MPIANPLKSLADRFTKAEPSNLPDRAALMDRRAAAEAAVTAAEGNHAAAALAAEIDAPGASMRLVEATEALGLAKGKLHSVMAAQLEADRIWQEHERKERADTQAQEDAVTAKAWDAVEKAAAAIEPAIIADRDTQSALYRAIEVAVGHSVNNPRVRQDLIYQDTRGLIAKELARLSPPSAPLPGANGMMMNTPKTSITPIAKHFADLVKAIKAGLNAR